MASPNIQLDSASMTTVFCCRALVCHQQRSSTDLAKYGTLIKALAALLKVVDRGARRKLLFAPGAYPQATADEAALAALIADAQCQNIQACQIRALWLVLSPYTEEVCREAMEAAARLIESKIRLSPPQPPMQLSSSPLQVVDMPATKAFV